MRLLLDPHALLDGRKGGRGPSLPPPRSAHSHTILQYYTHSRTRMHRRRRRAGWLLISPDRPSPFYPPPTHTPVPPQRRRKGAEVRWGRRGGGGGGNDLGLGSSPSHCHRLRAPPCSRVRGGRWINSFFRTCSAHTHMGGRTKGRSVLFEFPPQRGGGGEEGASLSRANQGSLFLPSLYVLVVDGGELKSAAVPNFEAKCMTKWREVEEWYIDHLASYFIEWNERALE